MSSEAGLAKKQKISIVIPTLNEEENLPAVLEDLKSTLERHDLEAEIIIVDGCSQDRTVEIAQSYGAHVICRPGGKGYALRLGIAAAKQEIIVMMDADCSHIAEEIPQMVKGIEDGCDICMGSRFMAGGDSEDITPLRRFGNQFFISLVNLIWGTKYTDLCYGYRCFRRSCLPRLKTRALGFGIETEIAIRAAKNNLKILELPSFEKNRKHGVGKLRTLQDGYVILKTILRELLPGSEPE